MSFAARFKAGSDIAGNLLNTYDAAKRKKDMAEIAGAQEITAYGPDDAAQIEAAAKAVGPDGKPYYTVGNDAAGNYTITPNFQNETGATPTDYAPSTLAAKGVSFLGKNYNAPLTETQTTGARQQAMAGVMERGGDVEGAMRYRELAQQGVRNAAQDARQVTQDARLAAQDARQGVLDKRNDDQFKKDEDFKASRAAIFDTDPNKQVALADAGANEKYQTDLAAYNQRLATPGADARALGEIGLAPLAPTKGTVTPGDQLAFYAKIVAHDGAAGKLGVTDMMQFDQLRSKLTSEGYVKTLKAAHNGATLPELVKLFGQQGQEKFDPALVASDTVGKNAEGVPTRIITFKDGRVLDTLKELESLDAADKLVARYYQGKTEGRAEAGEVRAVSADKRAAAYLGIAQTSAGLTNQLTRANIDEKNLAVTDKKALGELRDAYGVAVDSGDAKAIDAAAKKIHIYNRSGKAGEAASAFAQKVDLLMRANPGMSLAQVTDKAMAKAEQSADAYYAEILKPSNMGISIGPEKAEEFTRSAYPGWRAVAAAKGVTDAAVPAKGSIEDGHEFLGGDPKDKKNWRQVSSGKVN
jgi:hypothetical protein